MKLHEIQDFIGASLGKEAADLFGKNIEDMFYRIRSWALSDTKTPIDQMKERINKICKAIVLESIKTYLHRNYEHNWSVSVSKGDLLDNDMNVIEPIQTIKQHQKEIISVLEGEAMAEFNRGRNMANSIVSRAREFVSRKLSSPTSSTSWDYSVPSAPPRNYEEMPPLERLEIEIMRLEQKLPSLSSREAERLKELYDKCNKCAGRC